jgi:hypothetical protein
MGTHVERIICFGGSNMQGVATGPGQQSWAALLKDHFKFEINQPASLTEVMANQGVTFPLFYDLSVWADRSETLAKRVAAEADRRLHLPMLDTSKNLFVVSIGGTDSLPRKGENMPVTPRPRYERTTQHIAHTLSHSGQILYVGLTAVDTAKAQTEFEWPIDGWNATRQEYEAKAAEIFRECGGRAVELYGCSLVDPAWEVSEDGIHPSGDKGEAWIYHQVQPVFDAMLTEPALT